MKYYVAHIIWHNNPQHINGVSDKINGYARTVESDKRPEDTASHHTLNGIDVYEFLYYFESEIERDNVFTMFREEGIAGAILRGGRR